MKTRLLSILALLVLTAGFVGSGNYGRGRAEPAVAAPAARRQVRVLAATDAMRLVKHALGETRVPRQPRRIVSLSPAATDSLVALGIRPVLVSGGWMSNVVAPYLAEGLQGTTTVRLGGGIPLEAVLDANPDLIFIGNLQDSKWYGQLSRIAPTVALDSTSSADPGSVLLDVARVVGVADRARQRLATYSRRVEQAKASLAEDASLQTVVFLRFRQHTCVIYAQMSMFGPLLFQRLGLRPDPAMPRTMSPGGWDVLSIERLSTLHPGHIFAVIDDDSRAYYASVASTPFWKQIPAVQSGRVHRVAASTWLGGEGILANEAILQDVLAAMAPRRSP